jgi:co-chaperonin GroES (HSP10)
MSEKLNTSGLQPVEYKVLVKLDEEQTTTSGGLFIPETVRDQRQLAQVKGTLIACGGNAFQDWCEPTPRPGDRVYAGKYAGIVVHGADGCRTYKLCNDKDIAGIITEESTQQSQPNVSKDVGGLGL